jgi:hypothetical protein
MKRLNSEEKSKREHDKKEQMENGVNGPRDLSGNLDTR